MDQTHGIQHFIGNAEAFPVLRHWDFFNHAGVSPIPRAAAEALRRYSDQASTVAYLDTGWHRDIATLREWLAGLMNATKEELAFVKNTSEGLAVVANGIDWNRGDRIVTSAAEYPANVYPWMEVERAQGVELVLVSQERGPDGTLSLPLEKILDAASHPRTRM